MDHKDHSDNEEPIVVEVFAKTIQVDLQPMLECAMARQYHRLVDIRNKQGKDIEVSFDNFMLQTIAVGNGNKGMSIEDIINHSALKGLIETAKFFDEIEAELGVFDG